MDEVLGIVELANRDAAALDIGFAGWVDERIACRREARNRRDFGAADAIRDELLGRGVAIEDTPAGTRWCQS